MVTKSNSKPKKGVGIDQQFEFAPSSNELRVQHIVDAKKNCVLRFGSNEKGDVTTLVLPKGHGYRLRYRLDAAKNKCIIEIEQDLNIDPATCGDGQVSRRGALAASPPPPPSPPPMGFCFCPNNGLSTPCPPGTVASCTQTSITCVPGPHGSTTETLVTAPLVKTVPLAMAAPVNGHMAKNGSANGHTKPSPRNGETSKTATRKPTKAKKSQSKAKALAKK